MEAGIFIPISILGLRETYPPALLKHKASRLRKETGNQDIRSRLEQESSISQKLRLAALRPIKLLVATPVVTLNALYIAISYGILYLLIATFTFVFKEHYGFDEASSGLSFLPAGIGMVIGNYLIDAYPQYAASVTAALAILRSLLGALLPLSGLEMYAALGLGWGNSLLGFIALTLVPILVAFYVFGERIRGRFNPKL
ncbi:major facilitator superfamily protein [Colletotrichum kahawae]|uniref:Major facilitator superfamily protein n=1 Tax=Colletotrichum kahawae TaxID=34407 RepID=A0AAE0CYX1_COLKA|nr:major facilitator superfamily protein [Colletotrichum kahawae]